MPKDLSPEEVFADVLQQARHFGLDPQLTIRHPGRHIKFGGQEIIGAQESLLRKDLKKFQLQFAVRTGMEDLGEFGEEVVRPRVFPIGIYFETDDDELIGFELHLWKALLRRADCEVIADSVLSGGSKLAVIWAKTKKSLTGKELKAKLKDIGDRVKSVMEGGLSVARIVILAHLMLGHAHQQPPVEHKLPTTEAVRIWDGISSADSAENFEKSIEGIASISSLLSKGKKGKTGPESEPEPEPGAGPKFKLPKRK
jgi:hypothetical protein